MDPKLFENWDFLYDGSGDISLHVEAFDEGKDSPFLSQDVSSKRLKEKVGSGSAYHIELAGTFELVIHAVKDNEVYVSFFEKSSEYGWKRVERFVLNKQEKEKAAKMVYFGKPCGHYSIVLKD